MIKKLLSISLESLLILFIVSGLSVLAPLIYRHAIRQYLASKVVMLTVYKQSENHHQCGGTGFHVIGSNGKTYLMTNRHVCEHAKNGVLWATIKGRDKDYPLHVIEMSDSFDLCLVEPIPNVTGFSVGSAPYAGQQIYSLGHPRVQPRTFIDGEVVGRQMITINAGVIGKDISESQCKTKDSEIVEIPLMMLLLDRQQYSIAEYMQSIKSSKKVKLCYQTNTAMVTTLVIYPGASGSPIVDMFGRLVGVVYAGPYTGGWGYGVTLTDIRSILNREGKL